VWVLFLLFLLFGLFLLVVLFLLFLLFSLFGLVGSSGTTGICKTQALCCLNSSPTRKGAWLGAFLSSFAIILECKSFASFAITFGRKKSTRIFRVHKVHKLKRSK